MKFMTVALILAIVGNGFAQPLRIYRYPQRSRVQPTPPSTRPAPTTPEREYSGTSRSSSSSSSSSSKPGSTILTKPTVIGSPGTYVLTENISAGSDQTTAVILITSPNVTLELAGFTVRNRASQDPDCCGIAVLADRVTVKNGAIEGFDYSNQCGVIVGGGVKDFTLSDLRIGKCETGIVLNPNNDDASPTEGGRIDSCSVSRAAVGILAFSSRGVTISDTEVNSCVVRQGHDGEGSGALLRGQGFVVENSSFTNNAHGLRIDADYCTIRDCSLVGNQNTGAYVTGLACSISGTHLSDNGLIGLVINSAGCSVRECTIAGNRSSGIVLDKVDGAASSNTLISASMITGNTNEGIVDRGSGGTLVEGCHISSNGSLGLDLPTPSSVYKNSYFVGSGAKSGTDGGGNFNVTKTP